MLDLPVHWKVYGRPHEDYGADRARLPNAPEVRERITSALVGRQALVELIEVREEARAAR
ncbi:hypothetical protein [Streptomyces coeruleorubidus]|uniref:hypothetical protein n=1 Tax=Streptomyces coeruleorubidus TaxID=116188 RepID=UPI00369C05BF